MVFFRGSVGQYYISGPCLVQSSTLWGTTVIAIFQLRQSFSRLETHDVFARASICTPVGVWLFTALLNHCDMKPKTNHKQHFSSLFVFFPTDIKTRLLIAPCTSAGFFLHEYEARYNFEVFYCSSNIILKTALISLLSNHEGYATYKRTGLKRCIN